MADATLAIIKPDAVEAGNIGKIIDMIESADFTIVGMNMLQLSKQDAEEFYAIHKERPFFGELVEFMSRGPIVVMVLKKDNAVVAWRELMGDTDPAKAAEGTIRKKFGSNIGENATHGSDSDENAAREIAFFFAAPA